MDLILFTDDPRTVLKRSRYPFIPEAKAPPVSAERFAAWPEHMRREFALLTAEAGYSDRIVRQRTGITGAALERARESAAPYRLQFSDSVQSDAHVEKLRATKRRNKAAARARDA